jgi:Fe-S cluster assembly ATP-binding protein
MLSIQNLCVAIQGKTILNECSLKVYPGEVHAIMGPNGAGKSTLSKVLAGHPDYEVLSGEVLFEGKNLLELEAHERAGEGIFLGFQYPVEIPGVANNYFLKSSLNAIRRYRGEPELDAASFIKELNHEMKLLNMDSDFKTRQVNVGFSGGEKKRNEILQLNLLKPKLAVLDETDSGLDIDALKIVAEGVNRLRDSKRSFIIITHYQRLLDYIKPDFVHILAQGKIVRSGDASLALELEKEGYQPSLNA